MQFSTLDLQWFMDRACFFNFSYNLVTPMTVDTREMPLHKGHQRMLKSEPGYSHCAKKSPQRLLIDNRKENLYLQWSQQ